MIVHLIFRFTYICKLGLKYASFSKTVFDQNSFNKLKASKNFWWMLLNSAVFAKDLKYITVWWEERCSEYQQKNVKMKMKSKFQVLYVVIHEHCPLWVWEMLAHLKKLFSFELFLTRYVNRKLKWPNTKMRDVGVGILFWLSVCLHRGK